MNELPPDARILLVTEAAGGGSGRHFIDLIRELKGRGFCVSAIYSKIRAERRFVEELHALGVPLADVPMQRAVGPWDIESARALRHLMHSLGPFDVVHGHSSKAGALVRIVAPKSAVTIYTPHAFRTMDPTLGAPGRLMFGSIELLLAKVCTDGIITVSEEEHDHALEMGLPASKLFTVLNGSVPLNVTDRCAVRRELGIGPDAVVVGFVGRMSRQKNPLRFVTAVAKAAEIEPRVHGVMIGSGELSAEVERAAEGRLSILGDRDAKRYLPAFDVLAMTSNYEGMPYVLVEALHAGLPIISTTVGGVRATVRPGENGVCLPVDVSSDGFASALVGLLNGDTLARYSDVSRTMAKKFTVKNMTDETIAVYEACFRSKSQRCAPKSMLAVGS